MMELSQEGKDTVNKLGAMAKLSPALGLRILRETTEDGKKEVDKRTPRDTASMASTIRTEIDTRRFIGKVIIGGIMALFSRAGKERKFVNYSKFVEEGTIRQSGQHMLVRGVNAALVKKNSIAKQAFDNWVGKFRN